MIDELLPRFDDVLAFRDTLDPETDRGCALMAAAYLDSQLEELIRASIVDDADVADELLSQSKPLATFSSRIDLAYLLGHIGKMVRRDLHLIRKIRNDFGHTSTPLDFTHPPIAARCREMYHCFRQGGDPPRKRFTNTVLGVLACIHAPLHCCKRPTVKPDLPITAEYREAMRKSTEAMLAIVERLKCDEPKT
jgi:hypothetical protein